MRLLRGGRIVLLGLIILLSLCCLSGCWDIIPIEDRAIVAVLGLDKVGNNIRLSVQVPTVKNLIQTASNFTNRERPTFKPFTVESQSLLEDIQQLEDRIFQSMVIGTVKIIIVSPQAAREGLLDNLTIFLRQPTVSFQTLVLCADNAADEVVKFEAPFDIQPGLFIGKQQASALKLIRSFPIRLWDFIARVDNGITDPYLPIIRLDQENKGYVLEGVMVFNKDKLIGALSPEESYLFGVLTSNVEEGYKEINVQNKEVGFSKVAYKSRIQIVKRNGQAQILIKVNAQGTLLQIPKGFPNRVETYQLFKRNMEKQLGSEVSAFVKKLQAMKTDPVGFRKYMEVSGIKNWRETYPSIPVAVKVEFKYRNLSPAF